MSRCLALSPGTNLGSDGNPKANPQIEALNPSLHPTSIVVPFFVNQFYAKDLTIEILVNQKRNDNGDYSST